MLILEIIAMHMHFGVAEYTNSRYKVAIRAMGKALESTFYSYTAETVITTSMGLTLPEK